VLAPTVQALVDAFGWRGAYVGLGSMLLLVPIPLLLFALPRGPLKRNDGSRAAALPPLDLGREVRRPGVMLLTALMILPALVSFGVAIHLVPLLVDVGHATSIAAGALGAAVGISAIGKLAGGFMGDRIGVLPTFRLSLLLELAAIALLPVVMSQLVLGSFVVTHGISMGTQIAVIPVIAIAILGSDRFGTLFGLLQLVSTLVIGLSPIVPGLIFDATGSYGNAILFWVATMVLAVVAAFLLRLPVPEGEGVQHNAPGV
jgi:predicted MFS family arabinose efflux permease